MTTYDETRVAIIKDEFCKTVLKLRNPVSSRTLVKLIRRLYPEKIFIHLIVIIVINRFL